MASIIERSGTLYAQFYDNNRSPKRRRFSLKTGDRTLARQRLAKWERAYEIGDWDPWLEHPSAIGEKRQKRIQLRDALQNFLSTKRLEGRTESTLDEYERNVGKLFERVGGAKTPEAIKSTHLRSYLTSGGVKRSTQRKRYALANSFLSWCVRQDYLSKSPMRQIQLPKQGEQIPKAITLDELDAICEAVRRDYARKRKEVNLVEGDIIWMADCFRFMAFTGLRISEAARLRWGHIDAENGLIYVYQQKNQNEETIPFNDRARSVLDEREREPDDYLVFRSPRSSPTKRAESTFRHAVARHFKHFKNMAGIERRVTPHSLRHLFGFLLARGGCSAFVVKEAMRHASIEQSSAYVRLSGLSLKEQVDSAMQG
jgi:integrase/recombinase XerD